jgi:hypothetical protein
MAQGEPESATKALVFTQTKTGKIDTVAPHARVEVVARHRILTLRGELQQVTDSSIVVKGKTVPMADVKQLFVVNRRIQTAAMIFVYAGFALLLFAAWAPIIAAAYLSKHPDVPRTGKIDRLAHIFALRIGLILLLIGDLILIFRGHRYKFGPKSRWRHEVKEVPEQEPGGK